MRPAIEIEVVPRTGAMSEWSVEAIDYGSEGNVYVTLFAGPEAERRAREYAGIISRAYGLTLGA